MPNPNCLCPVAGFCDRHQMQKPEHFYKMCQGVAPTIDCGRKYWLAWEGGFLGATKPSDPVLDPVLFCNENHGHSQTVTTPVPQEKGFGDVIASALSSVGITEERVAAWVGGECGCAARKEKLNRLGAWAASFLNGKPTEQIETMING